MNSILKLLALVVACAGVRFGRADEPVAKAERDSSQRTINVIVVCYDPVLRGQAGQHLTTHMKWNDPRPMTENLLTYIQEASGGYAQYRLVDWIDLDAFPEKRDGFRYDEETFLAMWKDRDKAHQPDAASYAAMFRDAKLQERIAKDNIDEVWVWGAPYFGFDEYAMKVPGDLLYYDTDNPWFYRPYDIPECDRTISVMGFNYEVGEDNALHSFGHRCEGVLSLTVGRGVWDGKEVQNPWCRFTRQATQFPEDAQVGNVHGGPNAKDGYDYGQKQAVLSGADDWLNYPKLTGAKKLVDCETWGEPYHLNFQRWWLAHLPKNAGTTDGFYNNWWRYVVDYDRAVAELPPPGGRPHKIDRAMY